MMFYFSSVLFQLPLRLLYRRLLALLWLNISAVFFDFSVVVSLFYISRLVNRIAAGYLFGT